jgi:phosphatidylglycerol:prolipoprotein diacylglycerol transferase
VIWDLDPAFVRDESGFAVYYYALLVTLGHGLAIVAAAYFAEHAKIPPKRVTWLLIWSAIAAYVGGHMVHMVLFEPEALRENVFRLAQFGSGQSSHGAVLSAMLVLLLYAKIQRDDPRLYFDAWISGMVFTIPFVRLGNLANSELVGRRFGGPWAMIFPRHDCLAQYYGVAEPSTTLCAEAVARHPWPIYDALAGVALIALVLVLRRKPALRLPGRMFLAISASWLLARFALGFFNEAQARGDESSLLTMEQCASLGTLAACILLWLVTRKSAGNADEADATGRA